MLDNKKTGAFDPLQRLQQNLLDQAYDKFSVSLENMELMLALRNENWRDAILDKEHRINITETGKD